MSLGVIEAIITMLREERYRWTPVRRTYIDKKGTPKKRPLGLPTWSDKLLQEVIRLILEAYYEPQFSDRSHGFRPGRGCHTALQEIYHQWRGTVWFVEGDVTDCFGSLDHSIMRLILAEKIHDGRFLRLIGGLLRAGYLEDWRYHATLSGCPQGGVVSPVLSNIYLDRLDQYIEQTLLPAHNRGARRTPYRPYMRLWQHACRREQQGDREAGRALRRQMKTTPSRDPNDPGYRRLHYCRYADDWLLGFTGPRQEAEQIKAEVGQFLHDRLNLDLSRAKTLITHGRTQPARFLGYDVVVLHADHKHDRRGHRSINAGIGLKVPADVIRAKCAPYLHHGKPIRRTERIVDTDFSIVTQFQAEYRGVAEYYRLAFNRHRLGRLKYVMQRSLTKTLARKYRIRVAQVYRRYRAVLDTEHRAPSPPNKTGLPTLLHSRRPCPGRSHRMPTTPPPPGTRAADGTGDADTFIPVTNGIESLNSRFRQAVRRRGHFPTEQAAMKILYLTVRERRPNRSNPTGRINAWKCILNTLAITYGDRLNLN